eukprot:510997_1
MNEIHHINSRISDSNFVIPSIHTFHTCLFIPNRVLYCVCTVNNKKEKDIDMMCNFLHPSALRQKRDVDAWLHEDEFKQNDKMWLQTIPDDMCTYYEHIEKLPEFSTQLKHLDLIKLSWRDLDPYYVMDAASIRIARVIDPSQGSVFLDMCSAPGGKSLVMFDNILNNHNSELQCKLVSNEMGFKRSNTLKQVIDTFIPKDVYSKYGVMTNVDAKLWGLAEPNTYDGILLDAPCSGDRHLLKDKQQMNKWCVKSCKNLVKTQYALLRSALETVKIGGYVVYATCALNEMENDQLIHQIIKKRQGKVQLVDISLSVGEKTEFGWQILPDSSPFNEGPLYCCKLRRVN